MPALPLPLPVYGIDMLSQETALPAGCVRHAINVTIDRAGQMYRRRGVSKTLDNRWSTLFDYQGYLIAQQGRTVWRINIYSMARQPIATLESAAPIDCTLYNQDLYILSEKALWRMQAHDSVARPAGVAPPTLLPQVQAVAQGSIAAGQCAVALSWVDAASGEESPAVWLGQVQIPQPSGGIVLKSLTLHSNRRWRVYVTPPDGEILYVAEEFDAVWPQYQIGHYPKGSQCSLLGRRLFAGGQYVRGYKGRLLVAQNNTLYYSDALRPHVTHAAHGFISFASPIRLMEVVADGVYVGQNDGIYFLAGDDPSQWFLQRASDSPPVARSACSVARSRLGLEGGGTCALWLGAQGHMAGLPGGAVLPLNASRIRCAAGQLSGNSAIIEHRGISQLITLTATRSGPRETLAQDTHNPKGIIP